jgi:hypothetical protein
MRTAREDEIDPVTGVRFGSLPSLGFALDTNNDNDSSGFDNAMEMSPMNTGGAGHGDSFGSVSGFASPLNQFSRPKIGAQDSLGSMFTGTMGSLRSIDFPQSDDVMDYEGK